MKSMMRNVITCMIFMFIFSMKTYAATNITITSPTINQTISTDTVTITGTVTSDLIGKTIYLKYFVEGFIVPTPFSQVVMDAPTKSFSITVNLKDAPEGNFAVGVSALQKNAIYENNEPMMLADNYYKFLSRNYVFINIFNGRSKQIPYYSKEYWFKDLGNNKYDVSDEYWGLKLYDADLGQNRYITVMNRGVLYILKVDKDCNIKFIQPIHTPNMDITYYSFMYRNDEATSYWRAYGKNPQDYRCELNIKTGNINVSVFGESTKGMEESNLLQGNFNELVRIPKTNYVYKYNINDGSNISSRYSPYNDLPDMKNSYSSSDMYTSRGGAIGTNMWKLYGDNLVYQSWENISANIVYSWNISNQTKRILGQYDINNQSLYSIGILNTNDEDFVYSIASDEYAYAYLYSTGEELTSSVDSYFSVFMNPIKLNGSLTVIPMNSEFTVNNNFVNVNDNGTVCTISFSDGVTKTFLTSEVPKDLLKVWKTQRNWGNSTNFPTTQLKTYIDTRHFVTLAGFENLTSTKVILDLNLYSYSIPPKLTGVQLQTENYIGDNTAIAVKVDGTSYDNTPLTVKAVLNGVEKTSMIQSNGSSAIITWSSREVGEGNFNDIKVTVENSDGYQVKANYNPNLKVKFVLEKMINKIQRFSPEKTNFANVMVLNNDNIKLDDNQENRNIINTIANELQKRQSGLYFIGGNNQMTIDLAEIFK